MLIQTFKAHRMSTAKAIIQKYEKLFMQVHQLKLKASEKQNQLNKIEALSKMTSFDYIRRLYCKMKEVKFESKAMRQHISKLKDLSKEYEIGLSIGQLKCNQKQKQIASQKRNTEKEFLMELINFRLAKDKMLYLAITNSDIRTGLKQTLKHLDKILANNRVKQIACAVNSNLNEAQHERTQGEGHRISNIIQKGYKLDEQVIKKAKVQTKR